MEAGSLSSTPLANEDVDGGDDDDGGSEGSKDVLFPDSFGEVLSGSVGSASLRTTGSTATSALAHSAMAVEHG